MLDVVQNVIREQYIPADQNHMIEIDTKGRKGKMMCQIDRYKEETLLCNFDQRGNNKLLFPYFQEEHGFVSMCDYILFVEDRQSLFIFLIDLKDTSDSPKQQTGIAQTFAEFIVRRITEIKGKEAFPKQIEYRRIGCKTTNARLTTKGYSKLAYDEDGYLVIPDYHHFYTRWLMDLPRTANKNF